MAEGDLPVYSVRLVEGRLSDGSECWTALHLDLPGCTAAGRTSNEARTNLEKSLEAWLAAARELGEEVPPVTDDPVFETIYLPVAGANSATTKTANENSLIAA